MSERSESPAVDDNFMDEILKQIHHLTRLTTETHNRLSALENNQTITPTVVQTPYQARPDPRTIDTRAARATAGLSNLDENFEGALKTPKPRRSSILARDLQHENDNCRVLTLQATTSS